MSECFFFSSRRRHTRWTGDWSSDVCSSDLPAVLRLIQQVAAAGRQAGKPVAVCGEIASDVRLAPLLVGLGVDELSMTPTAIPSVRTVLTTIPVQKLLDAAEKIRRLKTVAEVEQVCNDLQTP